MKTVIEQNRHWNEGVRLSNFDFKRKIFGQLWKDMDLKLITWLTGSRRIGKSVLLKQLVDALVESGVGRTQCLIFEFKPGDRLELAGQVFEYYYRQVADTSKKIYIFLDELQYVDGYEVLMKEYFDLYEGRIKFVVTGSLSLLYKKRMKESLVGRFLPYRLLPLAFEEYLGMAKSIYLEVFLRLKQEKPVGYKNLLLELNTEFRSFLSRGRFPEGVGQEARMVELYLDTVSEQTLSQDAFAYFEVYKPSEMVNLYDYLKINSGGLVSLSKLANNSSFKTIANYLEILEALGVVYVVYNSLDPMIKHNKAKKVYVNSAFYLRNTKFDLQTAMGVAVESYVLERMIESGIEPITFFKNREFEVDFINSRQGLATEVKFRSEIGNVERWRDFVQNKKLNLRMVTLDEWEIKDGVEYIPACLV